MCELRWLRLRMPVKRDLRPPPLLVGGLELRIEGASEALCRDDERTAV